MTPDLPSELKVALERKMDGLSRSDAARRSSAISENYRSGGNSNAIRNEADALAYALARMPATFAAIVACLHAVQDLHPEFSPRSLLDVGAGPGTASWAAAQSYSSLTDFTSLDANPSLRNLAVELAGKDSRLARMSYRQGDAFKLIADISSADLVIASYLVGEMARAEMLTLADAMWSRTKDALLVVEPGTPAGYARILDIRARLVTQGAHVLAPCPHDANCPLISPDWCHFSQRLPRSRAHMHLKGASVPFEDEKFSYVVLTRMPIEMKFARVLAQPKVTKIAATVKLCTADGLQVADVAHRDKANYAKARKWDWGNAVDWQN